MKPAHPYRFRTTKKACLSWHNRIAARMTLILSVCLVQAGCGIFSSDSDVYQYPSCNLPIFEMHSHLPNFGFEEGYFDWVWDPGSETKEDARKRTFLRNRNHLSIRFYEEYGEAFHDSVLAAYNIEPVWSQTFGKEVAMPGFYRVKAQPAETYYTSYEDTTKDRLGNLREVEYVLPTYYVNERFCDFRTTPKILITFHDHYSDKEQNQILDSLKAADNVMLYRLFEWSKPSIYVTKSARKDPYSLYHHYYEELPYFKSISLNFAQTAGR
jgi:hypothetical protein